MDLVLNAPCRTANVHTVALVVPLVGSVWSGRYGVVPRSELGPWDALTTLVLLSSLPMHLSSLSFSHCPLSPELTKSLESVQLKPAAALPPENTFLEHASRLGNIHAKQSDFDLISRNLQDCYGRTRSSLALY